MPDDSKYLTTPVGRASWCHVLEPGENTTSKGVAKYEMTLLIPKTDDITSIRKLAHEVAKTRWGPVAKGSKVKVDGKTKTFTVNIKDGDEKYDEDSENYASYKGMWAVDVMSTRKPGIVGSDSVTHLTTEDQFYSGCWCRAKIHAFAWTYNKTIGVSFGLNGIQKIHDAEPFGGGPPVEEMFEPFESEDDDADFYDPPEDEKDDPFG